MSATETQYQMSKERIMVEPIWLEIRAFLEKEKRRIIDEIINYPPPIPACDVQFNFLLGERSRITQELRRLREISEKNTNNNGSEKEIRAFLKTCKHIDGTLEKKLKSYIEAAR